MELSIRSQGLSLLLALGVGAALGLLYDLLRPLRRRGRDTLWDLLFCAAAAVLCFLLAMREENGRLAGGQLLSSLLGLCLYLHVLSPYLAPRLERAAVWLESRWRTVKSCLKKICNSAKKLFPNHTE